MTRLAQDVAAMIASAAAAGDDDSEGEGPDMAGRDAGQLNVREGDAASASMYRTRGMRE